MRYAFTLFLVYCSSILAGQTYQQIHQRAIVIDTHNDILSKALLERGYTARDVKKILGGNFIRVFKANRL